MSKEFNYSTCNVTIVTVTPGAVLVKDGFGVNSWIPLSVCSNESRKKLRNGVHGGDSMNINIETWKAKQSGLIV